MLDLLNWESQLGALQLLKDKYNQKLAQTWWCEKYHYRAANTGKGLQLLTLSFSPIIWEIILIKE